MISGIASTVLLALFVGGWVWLWRPSRRDTLEAAAQLPLDDERLSESLDEMIERRVKFLTDYQDKAYAGRYVALVDKVRQAEARKAPGSTKLTEAVARYYFNIRDGAHGMRDDEGSDFDSLDTAARLKFGTDRVAKGDTSDGVIEVRDERGRRVCTHQSVDGDRLERLTVTGPA